MNENRSFQCQFIDKKSLFNSCATIDLKTLYFESILSALNYRKLNNLKTISDECFIFNVCLMLDYMNVQFAYWINCKKTGFYFTAIRLF